jgi:hypothetical protein
VKPGLDDEDSSRIDVGGHPADCSAQVVERRHVSDRREQTGDDIEPAAEVERSHVPVVDGDVGEPVPGDLTESGVWLDTLDAQCVSKAAEMTSGTARDIEQRPCLRDAVANQSEDGRGLVGVRLAPHRVHDVVDLGAATVGGRVILLELAHQPSVVGARRPVFAVFGRRMAASSARSW